MKLFIIILTIFQLSFSMPELLIHFSFEKRKFLREEPVNLQITIKNLSDDYYNFRLDKNLFYHFNLQLFNDQNVLVPISLKYLTWQEFNKTNLADNEKAQPITLDSGDSFTTSLNLIDWFELNESGIYFVKGKFNPNPFNFSDEELNYHTTEASFFIEKDFFEMIEESKQKQLEESLDLAGLPPYKTIELFLNFEKDKNWINYLKCIDIEKYLLNSYNTSSFYERYITSSSEEKNAILNEFKSYLIKNVNYKITNFKIIKTVIEEKSASVIVRSAEKFYTQNYIKTLNPETLQIEVDWVDNTTSDMQRRKEGYYNLELIGDTWYIIKKEVRYINQF